MNQLLNQLLRNNKNIIKIINYGKIQKDQQRADNLMFAF
jgi:hypothetical protein